MGTGASSCPAKEMMDRKRRQAINRKRYTQSEPSDFYCACKDGDIDYIKEHLPQMSIEDMDKLEANGDTALHVATRNDHKEIVQLLINTECSKTTLNCFGKMPYEESKSPQMKNIYERPDSGHFYDDNPRTSFHIFQHTNDNSNKNVNVQELKYDWIRTFKDYDELDEYSLNRQTVAMWFKFFRWVLHTYVRLSKKRLDFSENVYDLESDRDINDFLRGAIQDDIARKQIKEALIVAERKKDIVPLITLCTAKKFGDGKKPFYKILNEQLALASDNDSSTAHFCDRLIYELYMKSDQLEERAYIGLTFYGVFMKDSDVKIYEELTISGDVVAVTKTFISTTEKRDVVMDCAKQCCKSKQDKPVIFVFIISNRCNGIFSVKDASKFPQEDEVLIIPGNIFKFSRVVKNLDATEIHMDHMEEKRSTFKKFAHTIKAMRQRADPWQEPENN